MTPGLLSQDWLHHTGQGSINSMVFKSWCSVELCSDILPLRNMLSPPPLPTAPPSQHTQPPFSPPLSSLSPSASSSKPSSHNSFSIGLFNTSVESAPLLLHRNWETTVWIKMNETFKLNSPLSSLDKTVKQTNKTLGGNTNKLTLDSQTLMLKL